VEAGKAVVAECGGMMSVLEEVEDKAGKVYQFGKLLRGRCVMQSRVMGLGTQFVDLPEGKLSGHTFHFSKSDIPLEPLTRSYSQSGREGEAFYRHKRLTASYMHLYFPSNPQATAALFSS